MDPRFWIRVRKHRGTWFGAVLVLFVVSCAVFAPLLATLPPDEQFTDGISAARGLPVGPNTKFLLGADEIGRDAFSRLLYGARTSLGVAATATFLAVLIGTLVGLLSGYLGGVVDTGLMRSVDVALSLPFLLVAITLNKAIQNPTAFSLALILGGISWTTLSRIVRAKVMQARELEFVAAATALGFATPRIMLRHVLPQIVPTIIVMGTTLMAQMLIIEASMSFLGLGVPPPAASWGTMLHDGKDLLAHDPRLVILPGVMILCAVFGFNLVGEGVRDASETKHV